MARSKDFDEEEVLKKAVCTFWHKGYNATSMQDLVDALGISRSSLYDTYGDKHTLYIKALEHYQNSGSNHMCDIANSPIPAKQAIRQMLEYTATALLSDAQQKGCFMVNAEVEVAPHDTEVRDIVCKTVQRTEESFYIAIKKGQENGEITSKQDARALARFLYNAVKGIQVLAKSSTDKAFFDDVINTTLSVLD
ncbi:TetR/AcrR family transcriptional regulator [Mucilaginibacter sp. UR6-1]|uniref:TetR/AcrR family transcriptional regulator n=1 Tax=Mucilaginibacter sp. UR6-1 TaxID=1435643 RepID=UPI001E520F8E|nr:TetR/AcrR family transcriptional regulator [Mucilaginibacter sp. UR6-1]MCC8408701.1 TetR/AcrR family transcriptional regulator [Mucilaginibacter sp. UR6-1]